MKRITLLIAAFLGFSIAAIAQTPDCPPQQFNFVNGNGTLQFDNRSLQCTNWLVAYEADNALMSYTVEFQSANGINVPGSWGPYAGNTKDSNGFPSSTPGLATYCNLADCVSMSGTTINTPWVRISSSGATGTGGLRGVFMGWRASVPGGSGGGGGGGGGGCTSPCPVEGVDAPGAAPTVPPVTVSGTDGTDVRRILTDSSGRQIAVGGAATGAVPAGNPVLMAGFDATDVRSLRTDTTGRPVAVGAGTAGTPVGGVLTVQGDPAATPIPVTPTNPAGLGTFTSNQQAVTGTAAALATNTSKEVCVKALIANTINVYVGPTGVTTSTGFELPPGQGVCVPVNNTNLIFVVASTTGASVSWELVN